MGMKDANDCPSSCKCVPYLTLSKVSSCLPMGCKPCKKGSGLMKDANDCPSSCTCVPHPTVSKVSSYAAPKRAYQKKLADLQKKLAAFKNKMAHLRKNMPSTSDADAKKTWYAAKKKISANLEKMRRQISNL